MIFDWNRTMRPIVMGMLLLLLGACRRSQPIPVDTSKAKDIPREAAVEKLQELFPSVETVVCLAPKMNLRKGHIKGWTVNDTTVTIQLQKSQETPFLNYTDILSMRIDRSGASYIVKVFTRHTAPREHFQFWWTSPASAQRAVELLEALRQRN